MQRFVLAIISLSLLSCSPELQLKRETQRQGKAFHKAFESLSLPEQSFEHLWHIFNNNYALFVEKGIDWQAFYDSYRPLVSAVTSEEALVQLIAQMLNPLKDGHVRLLKEGKNAVQLERRTCQFAKTFKDKLGAFQANSFTVLENNGFSPIEPIYRTYSYESLGMEHLYYSSRSSKLGYIKLVECSHLQVFDQLLAKMADTRGLIIDLRYNLGGSVGKEMASRLIQSSKIYGYKVQKGPKGFSKPIDLSVKTQSFQYTQPIILLVSDATFSAAEEFVLVLAGEQHVQILGTNTGGYFSDVYNYRLPNGMHVWLSHEKYFSPDSVLLEDRGISPDIWMENTAEDLKKGVDPLIENAITLLQEQIGA